MTFDLTCIITGHREGRVCVPSLRSFDIAVKEAEEAGLTVERLYFLDNPDDLTRDLFTKHAGESGIVEEVSFKDQGLVRNMAASKARGKYTAFLDADDLWMKSWLVDAVMFLQDQEGRVVAHPAYNYFFESIATVFCHVDGESDEFDLDLLRMNNYWDALCVCETQLYREFPFSEREIDDGWAYEDWFWNCETFGAGIRHKNVPGTVLFKRRQRMSQTIRASTNKSRIRPNYLSRYDCPLYEAQ